MSDVARVKELLLIMKDTSELMVDLAYSSVFYQSESIANEVAGLEEEVGDYLTELQRLSLEAVREGDLDIDQALLMIRVAQTAELIANSALEIADVVLRDVGLHPVLVQAIRESDSAITKVVLQKRSGFADQKLRDLELESETGMRILAVKRSGRWHTGVTGTFQIEAEDLLIAAGPADAVEPFIAACAPITETD